MTEPRALAYTLVVDGESVALEGGMTLGRHLDNDLVIAGEDVLDYHTRIDVSPRGPVAVPLGDALLYLNRNLLDQPTGLMPGDRLEIGQSLVELELDLEPDGSAAPEADAWRICPPGDASGIAVAAVVRVGREPGSDLLLTDLHASRRHARVCNVGGSIWVQDLGSANGTFVNGERIRGARRVFHGDELRFDHYVCQLLGSGADLTPAWTATARDLAPLRPRLVDESGPEGSQTLEFKVAFRGPPTWPERAEALPAGAYLVGATGSGPPGWQRLSAGRTLIGRHPDCDLQLRDLTVSGHHAEILLRPEGATVTDLLSTNGTICNDRQVQSVRLVDGDRLAFGRVDLLYREITGAGGRSRWWRTRLFKLAAVALLGAALLVTALVVAA
jgi:pSer/pThr/pTyr-binding forkhead associated (FHA) protein